MLAEKDEALKMRTISLNQILPTANDQNPTQTTRELAPQLVARRAPATSHPSQSVSNNQAVSPCGALRSGEGESEKRARVRVSGETHAAKYESYALVFAKSELGLVSYDDYKFISLPSVSYDPFETALNLRIMSLARESYVLSFETKKLIRAVIAALNLANLAQRAYFRRRLRFLLAGLNFINENRLPKPLLSRFLVFTALSPHYFTTKEKDEKNFTFRAELY